MVHPLRTDSVDRADSVDFWTAAVSRTYVDLECTIPENASAITSWTTPT